MVCANHENKKHEIYFATDNHHSQNISVNSTAQLANYYARDGLFFDTGRSLELMANAWQLFAQCSINHLSYWHSTCLRRYSVPFCTLVVRQQLHGSQHASVWNAVCNKNPRLTTITCKLTRRLVSASLLFKTMHKRRSITLSTKACMRAISDSNLATQI